MGHLTLLYASLMRVTLNMARGMVAVVARAFEDIPLARQCAFVPINMGEHRPVVCDVLKHTFPEVTITLQFKAVARLAKHFFPFSVSAKDPSWIV